MVDDLVIRPATAADAEFVAAIYAHYVATSLSTFDTHPPSADTWVERIGAGRPFLVGEITDTIVGFAYVSPWRPKPAYGHTVEDTIYLDPRHIGCGHGRRLLAALLPRAAEAGARQVIAVIADTGDPASAALHRAVGFTEIGTLREVGRKHGKWVNTTLLQRSLDPGP